MKCPGKPYPDFPVTASVQLFTASEKLELRTEHAGLGSITAVGGRHRHDSLASLDQGGVSSQPRAGRAILTSVLHPVNCKYKYAE